MTDKTKKRPGALTWTGCILLVLAFLFLLLTLLGNKSLRESQDALEASGRPMTLEEIVPAEIPANENAALEFDAAVEQLRDELHGESDLFSQLNDAAKKLLEESPDPGALEEFRRLYESGAVAEALAVIEEGCLKEGYRNELDLSEGFSLELPHLEELMGLSRILAATVRLQAGDGDQAGAWDTALTSLRLANALENEPILVSQLVRSANIRMAIESIRSLDYSAAPASHLSEIEALLARIDDPAPFVAAVDGERIMGEQLFHASGSGMAQIPADPGGDLGLNILMGTYQILPPLRNMDRAAHANAMREYAEAMARPFSASDLHLSERVVRDVPFYSVITRITVPAFGAVRNDMVSLFAEARVTRTALAVLEYQRQHGTHPPDLASLGRDGLADPFTGEALVYRPDDSGFTISSVGRNLTHDGEGAAQGESDDIIWRFSEPLNAAPGFSE